MLKVDTFVDAASLSTIYTYYDALNEPGIYIAHDWVVVVVPACSTSRVGDNQMFMVRNGIGESCLRSVPCDYELWFNSLSFTKSKATVVTLKLFS